MTTSKLNNDLYFIKQFQEFCTRNSYRMVVYGGYGLDGYLRRITRNHGDIDLVVYGTDSHAIAGNSISDFIKSQYPDVVIKQTENPFQVEIFANRPGFGLNLYYVQTRDDPFINIHTVIKLSGEIVTNDPSIFPPPQKGSLEGFALEVQDQSSHLKDIFAKGGASEPKYVGDLKLLYPLFPHSA